MTEPTTEVTVTNWRTKTLAVWATFYAWAKLHPGVMIPLTAYLAGVATVPVLKLIL